MAGRPFSGYSLVSASRAFHLSGLSIVRLSDSAQAAAQASSYRLSQARKGVSFYAAPVHAHARYYRALHRAECLCLSIKLVDIVQCNYCHGTSKDTRQLILKVSQRTATFSGTFSVTAAVSPKRSWHRLSCQQKAVCDAFSL